MGNYTDNLFKKNKIKNISPRLKCCALIRDGVTHYGHKSHSEIRAQLGDENPYTENKSDKCGFMTTDGRFVDRYEAARIGATAGQCRPIERELLSSDIFSW